MSLSISVQSRCECASPPTRNSRVAAARSRFLRRSSGIRTAAVADISLPPGVNKVSPLGDRVFIKLMAKDDKSAGGVLLPESAVEQSTIGNVVALGSGRKGPDGKSVPSEISVGDNVLFGKYAGAEINLGGAGHMLLKEDDCIGIMAGDDASKLQPLGDRVLIRLDKAEKKSAGGILLTAASQEKPQVGIVVSTGKGALGPDGNISPMEVSAGSKVVYSRFAGTELKSPSGEEFIVMRQAEVLAVLE